MTKGALLAGFTGQDGAYLAELLLAKPLKVFLHIDDFADATVF